MRSIFQLTTRSNDFPRLSCSSVSVFSQPVVRHFLFDEVVFSIIIREVLIFVNPVFPRHTSSTTGSHSFVLADLYAASRTAFTT